MGTSQTVHSNCLFDYVQLLVWVFAGARGGQKKKKKKIKLDPLELELWVNICESRKMNPQLFQEQYLLLTFEPSPLQPQAVFVW